MNRQMTLNYVWTNAIEIEILGFLYDRMCVCMCVGSEHKRAISHLKTVEKFIKIN